MLYPPYTCTALSGATAGSVVEGQVSKPVVEGPRYISFPITAFPSVRT